MDIFRNNEYEEVSESEHDGNEELNEQRYLRL